VSMARIPGQTRALSSYAIRFEAVPDTPQGLLSPAYLETH
jgi:hypothetical protein